MTQSVAAFFDLDWTLLTVNSGALWVRRDRRLGRLTRLEYLQAFGYLLAYRLNMIDMERAMRRGLRTIVGEREETLRQWTRQWYYEEIAGTVAAGARRALARHRAAGHQMILLSTTSPYAAEVASEHLGLDGYICSAYEVRDGLFTGEPMFPICYGSGKVTRAEDYAAAHGIDLARSYFYTDSASDLPMLARVGFPRVVNPDVRLRLAARRRGWRIANWRK